MYINRLLPSLIFMLFFGCSWCQKKSIDTVYVYEEIIVHDTIYIEKPLNNTIFHNAILQFKDAQTGILSFESQGQQTQIKLDHLTVLDTIKKTEKKMNSTNNQQLMNWSIGIKTYLGKNYTNAFTKSGNTDNNGYGLGLVILKRLISKKWYASAGINLNYFPKSRTYQDNGSDSNLNGFYISNNQPNLLTNIYDECRQIVVPIQLHYSYKKFLPSVGIQYGNSTYYGTIKKSSGFIPLSLDQTIETKLKSIFWGANIELGYQINKYLISSISYSFTKSTEIKFYQNSTPLFTLQNNFNNRQISFGLTFLINALSIKKKTQSKTP